MPGLRLFFREFKKPHTWKTFLLIPITFYFLSVSLLQYQTILSLITNFTLFESITLISYIYTSPFNTFSLFNLSIFTITTILFASNFIALKLYVSKNFLCSSHVVSFTAVVSSLLGCLACCGSLLISILLGLFGVTLGSFPLFGQEIAILALVLAGTSFTYTILKIQSPMVCD